MRTITSTLRTVVLGLSLATVVAPTAVARAEGAAAVQPDLKKIEAHLREHQEYPATRAQLLASCNELLDFSAAEKRWYAARIPEGTYKSADEVLKVLRRK